MAQPNNFLASDKKLLRIHVDLATQAIPVGTTSNTAGLVLFNLPGVELPAARKLNITFAGMKAVTGVAGGGSTTALTAFIQKNGGNNLNIPASGALSLGFTAGAIARGTRDEEIGEASVGKTLMIYSGVDKESLKIVLAATGAATIPGVTTGLIELLFEVTASWE